MIYLMFKGHSENHAFAKLAALVMISSHTYTRDVAFLSVKGHHVAVGYRSEHDLVLIVECLFFLRDVTDAAGRYFEPY